MQILSRVIATELLKLRNTVALWLTFLYPLGSVIIASLFRYGDRSDKNPGQLMFINNFSSLIAFFLPFYAVLMVSFFCQMEHRNSMFKHLFALPVPKWALFFGKLIASFLLLVSAWVLLMLLLYISLLLLGFLAPTLKLNASFDHGYLFLSTLKIFLSAASMLVIQYILSLKLKNVVVSVSIGTTLIILPIALLFVLGITGLITNPSILQWMSKYDPYAFPFSFVFNFTSGGNIKRELFTTPFFGWLIAAILISVPGALELRRRNIK